MPPLDFPPGTPGATYTGPNGVIWSYDGAKWISGTGTTVYAPITDAALLGNPTAPTPAAGDADTSIATTAFVTNAVATSLHDVGRNYIHNSMFNIAQRGAGPFGTFAAYTMDRWRVNGNTDAFGVAQTALNDTLRAQIGDEVAGFCFSNTFTGNAAAGAYHYLGHPIENVRRLAGKTITVSFWASSSAGLKIGINALQFFGTGGSPSAPVWALTTGIAVALSTTWARYTATIAIPAISGVKTVGSVGDYTELALFFSSGANSNPAAGNIGVQGPAVSINLWGVQLEIGSVATPLEKLDPVTQLQQCQRFYWTGQAVFAASASGAAQAAYASMTCPVPMRGTANCAVTSNSNANLGTITFATGTGGNSIAFLGQATATGGWTMNFNFTASADL